MLFIILERRYETTDPNYLIGADRKLFVALDKKIPNKIIKLINQSYKQCMHDEKTSKYSKMEIFSRYNFPKIWTDNIEEEYGHENKYELIFQNEDLNNVPGELIDRSLVYNDSTYDSMYDTVYRFKITAIAIFKL